MRRSGAARISSVVLAGMLAAVLATSCGADANGGEDAVEEDDGEMTAPESGYVLVEGEPRTRIGPAEVEPGYLVEVPPGWAHDPPADGHDLQLSNLLPSRQGSSVLIVQRTQIEEPLSLDLAARTVERSSEGGRPRELRRAPEHRNVAGEPAVVFDQLEREPSPWIVRSVIFDHGGARFLVFFSSSEAAFDAEVELFENVVLDSWEWTPMTGG